MCSCETIIAFIRDAGTDRLSSDSIVRFPEVPQSMRMLLFPSVSSDELPDEPLMRE